MVVGCYCYYYYCMLLYYLTSNELPRPLMRL